MKRPRVKKEGTAVTIDFDDDRQARDYATFVGDDITEKTGTRGERIEKGIKGFFDGLERAFTRMSEGATGTIGIGLLALALGFLGWHSWHGWWEPVGLAPLSVIGPVLVLVIVGLSFMIAESRVQQLLAEKNDDPARIQDEAEEQASYKSLRWAAVFANAVAAISFQTSVVTDTDSGRFEAMRDLNLLRAERAQLLEAQLDIEDQARELGRMSPAAQSSGRIERAIDRAFRQQARNQLNEPVKGKTVGDLVGDCTDPLPNWQTYYDVYCPAILDRMDELDAVNDWEVKSARIHEIDATTDKIVETMPASQGMVTQARSLFGSSGTGLVMAALIALVFAAFEFLLGKLSYQWRLTHRKREVL